MSQSPQPPWGPPPQPPGNTPYGTARSAGPPSRMGYANCSAARAAGAAPVHTGEPGYGRHLDRDGDGVGCE
ncbi:excalibur calcium-binding domain-containing protein [Streptomyces sp. NBC_00012]|uniref:excalibur calcium-binding domain-containing protein n=1 Tax=Streptomyces sp. NBC_00012 TaxID=2975621 RepID=UPI003868C546